MNCLLIKCHAPTLFRLFNPIVTEPLELEYLAALLSGFGIAWRIHDRLLDRQSLRRLLTTWPADLYVLSGYNTAVPELLAAARRIRNIAPEALIVAGGVQAELCPADFFITEIDLVFRSDALNGFRALLEKFMLPGRMNGPADARLPLRTELRSSSTSALAEIPGLCWQDDHGWHQNTNLAAAAPVAILPDRRYLCEHSRRTHYLEHRPVALVKAALSCPYACSFCCCCQLNAGKYLPRAAAAVLEEIRALEVDTVWLVDDCLFTTRAQAEVWLSELQRLSWRNSKHIIAYIRADFAAANPDLLAELAHYGFREWIIGLEAVSGRELLAMNKQVDEDQNQRAVQAVFAAGARLMALFLVGPETDLAGFARLRRWIYRNGIRDFTVSLFTPLRGSRDYSQWESRLLTKKPHRFDFLHLVVKPHKLPSWLFLLEFWRLHLISLLRSTHRVK